MKFICKEQFGFLKHRSSNAATELYRIYLYSETGKVSPLKARGKSSKGLIGSDLHADSIPVDDKFKFANTVAFKTNIPVFDNKNL